MELPYMGGQFCSKKKTSVQDAPPPELLAVSIRGSQTVQVEVVFSGYPLCAFSFTRVYVHACQSIHQVMGNKTKTLTCWHKFYI